MLFIRIKNWYPIIIFAIILSIAFNISDSVYQTPDCLSTAASATELVVVIDAGHGGEDVGTVSDSGLYEKNLNFEISNILANYLTKAGFTVIMTRTEDKLLYKPEENIKGYRKIYDLRNRLSIANSYKNAILVSIHMNWFSESKYSGLQVYYGTNESSEALANDIQYNVVQRLQPENKRKIKPGNNLYLMENSINPSVLIECGFMSNPEECKKLSEKEYQKELSFAILCGIIDYIK